MQNTLNQNLRSHRNLLFKLLITGILIITSLPDVVHSQCSQLVWSDEFNGTGLDMNKWSYQIGNGTNDGLTNGWGNGESQYYTSRPENVNVTGGNLVITARAESYLGANYTSGRIRSRGKGDWLYGSFEARIKFPEPFQNTKLWPGFWMLPYDNNWPHNGEIDIVETGKEFNEWQYNGTLHYYYGGNQISGTGGVTINTSTDPKGDLSKAFHLYRVDWAPNSIKFFVDNVQIGATQNNTTTVGGAWPFDLGNKFHILFNMAVNGWFPGTGAPYNANYPLSMQVDYVRVYSTPSAVQITGNTKVLQGKKGVVYTVPSVSGNSYSWTVPSGATVVTGAGTNQVTVDYGANAASGNISVKITPTAAGCNSSTSELPVSVVAKQCTMTLEDFEGPSTRNLGFNFSTGWLNRTNTTSFSNPYGTFANPSVVFPNTSNLVGKYERNTGSQYDVLAYNDIVIGDADGYKKGSIAFNMMVRTDAPLGTEVVIQLENRANTVKGWPNGVHSTYTAKTGVSNSWTNLEFTLKDAPDIYQKADSVDQIIILFNPNSYTNHTYYFDSFKSVGVTPVTSSISGPASVCAASKGVSYSVTGFAGSAYTWAVPAGAAIVSGQGTNAIVVDFGTSGGNITVSEASLVNCAGPAKTIAITVNPICMVTADFAANKTTTCQGAKVLFTDKSTGTDGSQTYSWNFGAGASPATATTAGPIKVSYTSGGMKTVSLTVTQGGVSNTKTQTNYVSVTDPVIGCLFSNDFADGTVSFASPDNAFSHMESGSDWTVANLGHGEWENWTYTLNDGSQAKMIDFTCTNNKPVLKIRAKASANCLLRIEMLDSNGVATDFVPTYNMELTTAYQTFTINYSGYLYNKYGCTGGCGVLDSSSIKTLRFFVNPGYTSYPYVGKNKTYDKAFANGSVTIDWIGIGDNCSQVPPVSGFTASVVSACTTETVKFTDASLSTDASTKYSWSFGEGATPATATTVGPHNVTYNTSGSKTVSLVLAGGVSNSTKANYITVTNCVTGIKAISFADRIVTFPNPANSELNIQIDSPTMAEANFSLTNSLSQEVLQLTKRIHVGENDFALSLSGLENGLYFLTIKAGNQSVVKRISVVR